jgi:hypothetical protein
MAVTSQCKIALGPRFVFYFGTILFVADEKGNLHRIADPPEKKLSLEISRKAGTRQRTAQPPAPQTKTTSCKSRAGNSLAQKTPLSTLPTKEWTRITRKKEASVPGKGTKLRRAIFSAPSPSKKGGRELATTATPFYPDILFIGGRLESSPISDDEPTMPGEEPPQREARRRRNRRWNIRRHHEAGERDPVQPVSRDEVSEVGKTPDERIFRERRNSRRRDRRQAQDRDREQAEHGARLRRENPLFARNLNPDFARAMNTSSEVGGVLAQIANGLPRTPDAEGYRRLLTRAANHLLPLAHPPSDLRHTINSRRDAQSSINAERDRRHENEIRRQEEYDRDHGVLARSHATRVESAAASTKVPVRGWSRRHITDSPPQDRHHERRQEDTCGVSALTARLKAIQWPPNFKVSNVNKYEPKQDPGGWLAVYTIAVRAARTTEDVMTAYLPIVLGQDALQWL